MSFLVRIEIENRPILWAAKSFTGSLSPNRYAARRFRNNVNALEAVADWERTFRHIGVTARVFAETT